VIELAARHLGFGDEGVIVEPGPRRLSDAVGVARVEGGVVREIGLASSRLGRDVLPREGMNQPAGRRLKDKQGRVFASTEFGDSPQNVQPDFRVERSLVDQADDVVEVSYPITISPYGEYSTRT
jgi:hypothetical protein